MNSGLPQMKGFGDRQFSLSAPITPDYHENIFTRLRWDFESLGEYIRSMLPDFKKFGENVGLVAAMNFEMATLTFKALDKTAETLKNSFESLKKIADNIIKAIGKVIGPENVKRIEDSVKGANKILLPSISPFRIPSFLFDNPTPRDFFATGGIVRKPHLGMVGEAGPEAIIPLKRNKRSLGLLDAAAGAIGVGAASSSPTIHKTIVIKPTINITGVDPGTAQQVVGDILSLMEEAAKDDYRMATT